MTDAFDLMSNSIFDNIINNKDDNAINLDDIWKSDLSNYDPDIYPLFPKLGDFCEINNIEMDSMDYIVEPADQPYSEILQHDCMLSGTCLDEAHPSKKKNYRFFANGGETFEMSDIDIETEMMLENSLPTLFNPFSQTFMQKDPASVFQEIVESASQNIRYYIKPSTSKVNTNPQFAASQQIYNKIPIYNSQNNITEVKSEPTINKLVKIESSGDLFFVPRSVPKMTEVKNGSTINKLIKLENAHFEPIVVKQEMHKDTSNVFHENVPSTSSQNMNYYLQPSTSKFNKIEQFPASQQIYNKIPIYNNQNCFDVPRSELSIPNLNKVKSEATMKKLVKIENLNIEPITVHRSATIDEKRSIQQVFFYNQEPAPVVSYFPQLKYEHYNVIPQPVYFQYPNPFDNANDRAGLNNDVYGLQNSKISMDRSLNKKQKLTKKRLENKRKYIKKSKVKDKKPQINDYRMKELSRLRPSTSPGSDEVPVEKRVIHNSMERQRRIGLKNLFVELKQAIPTLDDHNRVPKVSILHEAITFCRKLQSDEKQLDDLRKKNCRLLRKYNKLYKTVNK